MTKLVHGVGVYEKGKYKSKNGNSLTPEYMVWSNMVQRCNPDGVVQRNNPTYIGCIAHPTFITFQSFAEWCQTQIGFGLNGYALDKDLLVPGNKTYGPDTCVFIPQQLNKLLVKFSKPRTNLTGVYIHQKTGKFCADIVIDGKKTYLGLYDNEVDASVAYQTAKYAYIKQKAEQFKDQIDPRAYSALLNYKL